MTVDGEVLQDIPSSLFVLLFDIHANRRNYCDCDGVCGVSRQITRRIHHLTMESLQISVASSKTKINCEAIHYHKES